MTVAERVSYLIERAVLGGEFAPGDRLPPERVLAERFGATRNAVREAIRRLEALGLLETAAQSGSYVRDYPAEASFDLVVHLMGGAECMDDSVFRSLCEYREMLEPAAARLAALRDGAGTAAALLELAGHLSACADPAEAARIDYLFHSALVAGSGNILFRSLHNTSRELHLAVVEPFFRAPGTLADTVARQRRVARAVGSGDPDRAAAEVGRMLARGRRVVESLRRITR